MIRLADNLSTKTLFGTFMWMAVNVAVPVPHVAGLSRTVLMNF